MKRRMPKPPSKQPRTRFSRWLVKRGISSQDLAAGIGLSVALIHAWRCGRREPRLAFVRLIAQFCGVEAAVIEGLFARRKLCPSA